MQITVVKTLTLHVGGSLDSLQTMRCTTGRNVVLSTEMSQKETECEPYSKKSFSVSNVRAGNYKQFAHWIFVIFFFINNFIYSLLGRRKWCQLLRTRLHV